jgi:hypothetical protein
MKRRSKTPTALDRIVIETCERKIRLTDGREMSAVAAMVSRDAAAALRGDDQATRRIRTEYARACERKADRDEAERERVRATQLEYFELFATAERLGLPPPNILPHPAHVRVTDDGITITGPVTAEERAWWEFTKAEMRRWSDSVAAMREFVRRHPDEETKFRLRKIRALIERSRRTIPPGWDWKESIYTLGSSPEERARYAEKVEQRLNRASPEIRRKIDEAVASWRIGERWSSRTSLKKSSTARGARLSLPHPA